MKITDQELDSFVVDDATIPSGNTGKPGSLFSWLANRIKLITGKTHWYDAPSISLEGTATHVQDTSHVGYVTTTGSNNAYLATFATPHINYAEGMAIAVNINIENTGSATINVDGLGAKVIKKANGNNVSAGNLKSGSIYTLRYNGVNFILQGDGDTDTHIQDTMPHRFTDGVITYQYGFSVVDGILTFNYEEVV